MSELKVKYSGSWRNITAPEVKYSGSWRAVQEIEVKSGGVWRTVFATASSILYLPASISLTAWIYFDPGEVWIDLWRSGDLTWSRDSDQGGTSPNVTNCYVMDADRYSNCGDDFEFKLVKSSGNISTATLGYTDGSWYTINQTRSMGFGPVEPYDQDRWSGVLSIREKADTGNIVTTNLSLIVMYAG